MYSSEFRWQNFRPFVDTGWVAIKPITILIGPNNSGKSSLLAPLLILWQTLRSGRAQNPLVLRGGLINAGSFSDIVNGHDPSKRITFSLRFRDRPDSDDIPKLGGDAPGVCSFTFGAEKSPGVIGLYQYSVADAYGRTLLTRTKRSSHRYTLANIEEWAREDGERDINEARSSQAAERAIRNDTPFHFLFQSGSILNAAISTEPENESDHEDEGWLREEGSPVRLSRFVVRYAATVGAAEHYIRQHALDLAYIGPLRQNPQRLYNIAGDAPPNVGVRGQNSAELVLRSQQQKSVINRIDRWLNDFGLKGSLIPRRLTDTAFELIFRSEAVETNFADLGFGFSQLLPLIVQGLLARQNTLLVAEQPEIHLNPRLQARLADLFRDITRRNVGILVETHSEHLLLAIRRLVAEGELRSNDVAIYFVESTDQGSRVKAVPLQENGHIEPSDWPEDFFDESLRESLGLASAQARRRSAR